MRASWLAFSLLLLGCSNGGAADTTDSQGTTGDGDGLGYCGQVCFADADCQIGGSSFGYACISGDCLPAPECTTNEQCIAQTGEPTATCVSLGLCFVPCTSDDDCASDDFDPVCNVETGICGCGSDADCPLPYAPICDVDSGECRCGSDAHCAGVGVSGFSVCTADGQCGCDADQQCIDGQLGDQCNEGLCNCTSDASCSGSPSVYDGGVIACKGL